MCRENERTHKHHIIPRYMGGTDAAKNLVEITVTQHAMYHFCNYQLLGNEEDKIAWRMLSGIISVDNAKLEAIKLGGKRGNEVIKEKFKNPDYLKEYKEKCKESFNNSPHKEKIIERAKLNQPKAVEASKTPEARQKQKEKLLKIEFNKGEKNPQYGTMWITDGTIEGSYRIKKGDLIPEGFRPGAVFNTENYIFKSGEENPNYNKVWITNGNYEYTIDKDEIIPEGYYKGRSIIFKTKCDKDIARQKGLKLYEEKRGIHAQTHEEKIEVGRKGGKISASQKWMCTETGHISNAGPLTIYQKNRGIDISKRIKL